MNDKIKDLPDEHHVMRHVPWTKLLKDDEENVLGILHLALVRRADEEALSVNWLEYHGDNRDTNIRESVWGIRRGRSSIGAGGKSEYAIANVGKIKSICRDSGVKIRILHEPDYPINLGHSGIRRLPIEDISLLDALAEEAFTDRVQNVAVPAE